MMLGATRPTVTVVAGTLQRAGLITYHRGHVTILDGRKLEAASCECYRAATNLLRSVTDGRSNLSTALISERGVYASNPSREPERAIVRRRGHHAAVAVRAGCRDRAATGARPGSSTKPSIPWISTPSRPATSWASAFTRATRAAGMRSAARPAGAARTPCSAAFTPRSFRKKSLERGGAHAVVKGDGDLIWPRVVADCLAGRPQPRVRGRPHRRRSVRVGALGSPAGAPVHVRVGADGARLSRSTARSARSGGPTGRSPASAPRIASSARSSSCGVSGFASSCWPTTTSIR